MPTLQSTLSFKMYVFPRSRPRIQDGLTDLQEKRRQKHFINLIPSENFTSQAVLDALGSVMQSMLATRRKIGWFKLTSLQTSTLKDTQVHDIMVETSLLMRQRDYANLEHY